MNATQDIASTAKSIVNQNGALGLIAIVLILFLTLVVYRQLENQAVKLDTQTEVLKDIRTELSEMNNRDARIDDISQNRP